MKKSPKKNTEKSSKDSTSKTVRVSELSRRPKVSSKDRLDQVCGTLVIEWLNPSRREFTIRLFTSCSNCLSEFRYILSLQGLKVAKLSMKESHVC